MKTGAENPELLKRKCQRGQSILESLICMIVLALMLLGLLQLFHLSVARLLTDYSSFCSARSYAVGFADYLTLRSARIAAIGASGKMVRPDNESFSSSANQFWSEEMLVQDYIQGIRWLEYEYWLGENEYDVAYYHPDVTPPSTTLTRSYSEIMNGNVDMQVRFNNYPFPFFDLIDKDRIWFSSVESSVDIGGESEVMNYSWDYISYMGAE